MQERVKAVSLWPLSTANVIGQQRLEGSWVRIYSIQVSDQLLFIKRYCS
jgi:hypothetical protein